MPGFPESGELALAASRSRARTPPNAAAQAKMRRRSSLLVNMVADVATQASEQAGVPLSRLRIVVGSAFGELATLVAMLDERERDGLLSPLRFQNSVHNSAAGHLSIAHRNKTPAMSLAAGNDTVAMVLLEAMTLLALGGDEVLAIVATSRCRRRSGRDSAPPRWRPRWCSPVDTARRPAGARDPGGSPAGARGIRLARDRPLGVDGPCAAILPLITALGQGRSGRVRRQPGRGPALVDRGDRVTTWPPIVELVPHRPPMLLLDRVLAYDGECVTCETVLRPDSPFADQGHVPAVVGIEYMAQTIAAGAGLRGARKGRRRRAHGIPARLPQPDDRGRQLPGRRPADHRGAPDLGRK